MQDPLKIQALRDMVSRWNLDDAGLLSKYTDEELGRMYNGIGPEAFPDWIRSTLDGLNPTLEPVAFIHDVEWSQPEKSKEAWKESNRRFYENGVKAAKAKYAWWNPLRYRVIRTARIFADLCSTPVARKAYLAGGKKS